MKKHGRYHWWRSTILGFAIVAPIWTIIFLQVDLLLALGPLFISHMLVLYPTLNPHSQWWGPVLRSFETQSKEVWLTIDDGPCAEHTEKILDLLDRYGASATFFVIGMQAKKFPDLIRKISERGHEIANHTLTHPSRSFWRASQSRIFAEIDGCDEAFAHELPRARLLFRAPAGLKNFLVHGVLRRRAMSMIGWTARGFDTARRSPDEVATRIVKHTRPGAIVLLHEGHQIERDPQYNPACVEETLRRLTDAGYRFVIPKMNQMHTRAAGK